MFAALALVVMTSFFNPVGVPDAFAQATTRQAGGTEAQNAIKDALGNGRISADQANTLTNAVTTQSATVTVNAQTGALVLASVA
jgi:hypothetical protein